MGRARVFVHIVTYNNVDCLEQCLGALLRGSLYEYGVNLRVMVSDNHSNDGTPELVAARFPSVELQRNQSNLGFSGGHNQGMSTFLECGFEYTLILNPDLAFTQEALEKLVEGLERDPISGAATPLLLRCDQMLRPLVPAVVDAAGMYMTPQLRHLDGGAGMLDNPEFHRQGYVFGGTGACLLLRREFVVDVVVPATPYEASLFALYPQLGDGFAKRIQLFDEAFFAYREDADLAWRAQLLGWKCLFVPESVGYHRRHVTPDRRHELPPLLNAWGVRNRFLLQLNNFGLSVKAVLYGILVRNIVVVGAVVFRERTSFRALIEVIQLARRAWYRRAWLRKRARISRSQMSRWFRYDRYVELVGG